MDLADMSLEQLVEAHRQQRLIIEEARSRMTQIEAAMVPHQVLASAKSKAARVRFTPQELEALKSA